MGIYYDIICLLYYIIYTASIVVRHSESIIVQCSAFIFSSNKESCFPVVFMSAAVSAFTNNPKNQLEYQRHSEFTDSALFLPLSSCGMNVLPSKQQKSAHTSLLCPSSRLLEVEWFHNTQKYTLHKYLSSSRTVIWCCCSIYPYESSSRAIIPAALLLRSVSVSSALSNIIVVRMDFSRPCVYCRCVDGCCFLLRVIASSGCI